MNKFYRFFISILFLSVAFNNSFAVAPTYNMTIKNITTQPNPANGSDSLLFFEVWILWTNSTSSDVFEFASSQMTIFYNTNITAGTLAVTRVPLSGSFPDFPTGQQNPTVIIGGGLFQASANLPVSTNNFYISSVFPGNRMLRVKIRTTAHIWNNVTPNLRFKLGAAPNSFAAYFNRPVDPADSENQLITALMDTVVNHYSTETNPILPTVITPVANFFADSTHIIVGRSVNFTDSSLNNPTSWSWSFPGGTPSSSTLRNPTGIMYNTPGSYSVSLTASNSAGPNTLTKTNYIVVLGCTTNWQNKIMINDAGNIRDTLTLGTSPAGTNGIDSCLGELLLPPVPPSGAFDTRFILPNGTDASKKDFRSEPINDILWTMSFQPSTSGYPITFAWDRNAFPSTGLFYLRDLVTGTIVNVDMKAQGSYTLTNPGITQLKIQYQYLLTMGVTIKTGWNILSLPLKSSNMSVSSIFPNAASVAYGFNGSSYTVTDTFKNGKGYWLKFNRDTTYNDVGLTVSPKNIPVVSGWNLIGPFDENIPVTSISSTPSGIVISPYYGYNNGYFIADTLKAGKGYWVKCTASGILFKNTTDNLMMAVDADSLMNHWTRLEISDNENNISKLYLANSSEITENYDLPPVPPEGIFDIRYGSDKFIETFGQTHSIKINATSRPLKIKAFNINGNKLRIKDGINGSIFNKMLEEGVEIDLNQNLSNLTLLEENLIPDSYGLSQNYPNPFNPVTTIKYQIPTDGFVKIILYNVLGKEIKTLVNENRKAGSYEIVFDASNLSSGVYFYKMQVNTFMDMKRMILIK